MPAKPTASDLREAALPPRIVEMFDLPGDLCANPACRRKGRCLGRSPQGSACLDRLGPGDRKLYRRLLDTCLWADRDQLHFLYHYIRAVDDPYLWLVGEIVRRVQPRGHWLHRSLPWWYRYGTGRRGRPVISVRAAAQAPVRWY
ncbi:hypothetical protein [Pararhizobium sp. LjRoot238]|uniref:hypothetical protein n=1 Tax=Pararhizobium sp. LjRoot238 TaxID=3342293 RepID=UPI003ECF66D8